MFLIHATFHKISGIICFFALKHGFVLQRKAVGQRKMHITFYQLKPYKVHKVLLTVLTLFVTIPMSFSQSSLNGNESYFEKDYFLLQHTNDINFIIPGNGSNDVAFTSSFLIKGFVNQKDKNNRLLSFGIQTDLYTQREGGYYFDEEFRLFFNEYFTEISSVEFSMVKFVKKDFALQWAGGIGLLNKDKPIPGLALWIQGGEDGAGGFHKLLDNLGRNNGQVNISREKSIPFVYISPAASYFFNLFPRNKYLPHTLVTELGLHLCTNMNANWLYLKNNFSIHLLQLPIFRRIFLFDFIGAGDMKLHPEGFKVNTCLGIETSFGRIALGYELTKQFGDENSKWVDFVDREDLYRVFIKVRLKKQTQQEFLTHSTDKGL